MEVDIEVCDGALRLSAIATNAKPLASSERASLAEHDPTPDLPEVDIELGPGWFESSRQLMTGLWICECEDDSPRWGFDELEAAQRDSLQALPIE